MALALQGREAPYKEQGELVLVGGHSANQIRPLCLIKTRHLHQNRPVPALRKITIETGNLSRDEMRDVIETEWPDLAAKLLPPKCG
jgi:hypothetical protein